MARRAPRTGTPRTSVLGVRVPPEQRQAIEAAAAAAGMTASAFVAATMARAIDERRRPEPPIPGETSVSVTAMDAIASGARPANDPSRSATDAFRRVSDGHASAHDDIVEEMRRLLLVERAEAYAGAAKQPVNSQSHGSRAGEAAVNSQPITDVEREAAVNSASSDGAAARPAAVNEAASDATPAVNTAPPVAISATIPVYGQIPTFTLIGTGAPANIARVSRWQVPTLSKLGSQGLAAEPARPVAPPPPPSAVPPPPPPVPPPPAWRVPRLQLKLDREVPATDARRGTDPPLDRTDPAVIYELKRIGNNINQIAHAANSGLTPDRMLMVNAFRHLFEALDAPPEFHKRLAAIRTRAEFNDSAHPQPRRRFP